MAQIYDRDNEVFSRLQRRIDTTERSYHRTLAALQKIESLAPPPGQAAARPEPPVPDPQPPPNQPPTPEIGFVPSTPPTPIGSAVSQPDTSHEIPLLRDGAPIGGPART